MKTVIYLIRHAEQYKEIGSNNSSDSEQIENEKIILSIDGEKQAEKLSNNKELKNIDYLFSSNYVRAKETAKYICNKNNIILNIDARLNERKLGNNNELKKIGKDKKYRYTEEQILDRNLKTLDGENANEVNIRFTECINELLEKYNGKKIALISHGAAIRFYLLNWCNTIINENEIIMKYKDEELFFNSPGIIKLTFNNKILNDIKLIKN